MFFSRLIIVGLLLVSSLYSKDAYAQRLASSSNSPQQLNKVVAAGQTIQIVEMTHTNPDCTSANPGVIKILEQPTFGTASIVDDYSYPQFPITDPHFICNRVKAHGLKIVYTSQQGYTGPDSMIFEAFTNSGTSSNEVKVYITVK